MGSDSDSGSYSGSSSSSSSSSAVASSSSSSSSSHDASADSIGSAVVVDGASSVTHGSSSGSGDSHEGSGSGGDGRGDDVGAGGEGEPASELPPLEGRVAWTVVAASFVVHMFALGLLYTFGVFLVPMTERYKAGRGVVSLVGGLMAGLMLVAGVPVGMLTDRFGFHVVQAGGGLLIASGMILTSFAESVIVPFFTYSLLLGVGLAMSFVPAIGSVGQWFDKKRGLATGVAVAGSGVGNLVLPLVATQILTATDLPTTLRIMSVAGGFVMLASLFARRRVKAQRSHAWHMFKNPTFLKIFLSGVFAGYGYLVPFVHLPAAARDLGHPESDSALLLSLMGMSSIFGRILLGLLADRIGNILCIIGTFGTMATALFIWAFLEAYWTLVIFALVFGFVGGGFISLLPTILAEFWGAQNLASMVGILYFSAAFGNVIGPTGTGLIFDATGRYTEAILVAACTMAIGTGFLVTLPSKPSAEDDAIRLGGLGAAKGGAAKGKSAEEAAEQDKDGEHELEEAGAASSSDSSSSEDDVDDDGSRSSSSSSESGDASSSESSDEA